MTLRVGMVAGEVSGDLLAGLLLQGLRARWPGLHAYGIGGPQMARHGFEALWPHEGRAPELECYTLDDLCRALRP